MNDKKCEIRIEFQAKNDEILKLAVRAIDAMVNHCTGALDVTATIDMPDKFNPYAKS